MYSGLLLELNILLSTFVFYQLAWAPGRGVKGATFKDYWDLESGASYVPWDKISNEQDLEKLSEGGWIVPETGPPGMKLPEIQGVSLVPSLILLRPTLVKPTIPSSQG